MAGTLNPCVHLSNLEGHLALQDQSQWAATDGASVPISGCGLAQSFFSRSPQLPESVCVCLVHFERRVSPTESPIKTGTFVFCRVRKSVCVVWWDSGWPHRHNRTVLGAFLWFLVILCVGTEVLSGFWCSMFRHPRHALALFR